MRRLLIILGSAVAVCSVVYLILRRRRDAHKDADKAGLEPSLIHDETRESARWALTIFPSSQHETQVLTHIASTAESEPRTTASNEPRQVQPCDTGLQDTRPENMPAAGEPNETIMENKSA